MSLTRDIRQVLAELELISHGTITNYNPSMSIGEKADPRPPGGSGAEHIFWRHRYEQASTDDGRRKVIREAREELDKLRRQEPSTRSAGETTLERNVRIVKEGEGFSARQVAIHFNCGERDVRKARMAAGREPELGKQVSSRPQEKAEKARELIGQGVSTREASRILEVGQTQIMRWIRDSRAA